MHIIRGWQKMPPYSGQFAICCSKFYWYWDICPQDLPLRTLTTSLRIQLFLWLCHIKYDKRLPIYRFTLWLSRYWYFKQLASTFLSAVLGYLTVCQEEYRIFKIWLQKKCFCCSRRPLWWRLRWLPIFKTKFSSLILSKDSAFT